MLPIKNQLNKWKTSLNLSAGLSAAIVRLVIILPLFSSAYVQALVNGKNVADKDWRSVAMLELIDPDNGQRTTCTAVIVSAQYAITSASCLLHEESAKQVAKVKLCIGSKRPFNASNDACFETSTFSSHHKYINSSAVTSAYNLTYIKFKLPLNLNKHKIKPATLITPNEFSSLITSTTLPDITWIGFDAKGLNKPVVGIKQQGKVSGAEFNYQTSSIHLQSNKVRLGSHYQGMASFVEIEPGVWRLLGLVSQSNPDRLVSYYPELNPCDEDPILVRYPKPIIQVSTTVTALPVAACSMALITPLEGYDELSCKRLLKKNIDWDKAIQNSNPQALRQQALTIYESKSSKDDAGEIYKSLYLAHHAGDDKATLALATFLSEGKLFAKDIETAQELISKLVKQGEPTASFLQAKILLFPDQNNEIKASSPEVDNLIFKLLQKSANTGIAEAQYLLARFYQQGISVKKSHKKAYEWYSRAAMQGSADAQFQLGMQWKDGRGVRAYLEVAQFWIQQSAAQSHIEAQNQLGLLKGR